VFASPAATARQCLADADCAVRALVTTTIAEHRAAAGESLAISGRLTADLEGAARDVSG
jgi:hypothetical protein